MAAITKALSTAAAAVSAAIRRDEPLAAQVAERLSRANARRTSLKAEVDALALDIELGDRAAAERQRELQAALSKAAAEVERLEAALATARDRDAERETEVDLAALKGQLAKYEGFAAARVQAMIDLTEASRAATEASRRFLAATSLMQDATPAGCDLPRGLILGRDVSATVEAVQTETDRILEHVRSLAQTTIAFRRGEEIEQ